MKNILVLFLISNFINAQSATVPTSILEKNDFKKAIIHFVDGTSIEGLGKIKTIFTSREEVIVFKIEEKDKDQIWTVKDATGITIIGDEYEKEYQYLKVSKYSFSELFEVITGGFVKLYQKKKLKVIRDTTRELNINYSTTTTYYENITYYLKKESEEFPTKITDNYIKSTSEYMKDCEPLVRKIKNHEYDFSRIKELVDYYNDICGEE